MIQGPYDDIIPCQGRQSVGYGVRILRCRLTCQDILLVWDCPYEGRGLSLHSNIFLVELVRRLLVPDSSRNECRHTRLDAAFDAMSIEQDIRLKGYERVGDGGGI